MKRYKNIKLWLHETSWVMFDHYISKYLSQPRNKSIISDALSYKFKNIIISLSNIIVFCMHKFLSFIYVIIIKVSALFLILFSYMETRDACHRYFID